MGKTVTLEGRALDWARGHFRTYYGAAVIDPPPGLPRREFAWFPFTSESLMRRHVDFPDAEAFRGFVRHEAPRHVYYSTAYFGSPGAPTMAAKEWLGADVIFDLDADHLRDAGGRDFAGQLALVRDRVRDLYDDFLRRDLGIDPSNLLLVFSGGRGYHVHIRDEAYARLGTPERRELVDYVLGSGVDPMKVLVARRSVGGGGAVVLSEGDGAEAPRSARGRESKAFKQLPARDAPGWPGRIARSFDRTLARWEAGGKEAVVRDLLLWAREPSLTPARARALAVQLIDRGKARQIRETGSLDVFAGDIPELLLEVVLRQATVEVQGETDAPVTTDLHRLIRLPGSLHGGTGFRVTPLARERLDRFDPFQDALPFVGGGRTMVELTTAVDHPFDPPVVGGVGERRTLPDAVALFLVLRGEATLPPGPGP